MIIRCHYHKNERRFTFCITFSFLSAYIILCLQYFVCSTVFNGWVQILCYKIKGDTLKSNFSGPQFPRRSKEIIKWVKLLLWDIVVDYFLVCSLHRYCYKYIFPYYLHYRVSKVSGRVGFLCANRKMHLLPCKIISNDPAMSSMCADTWTFIDAIVTLQTIRN